MGNISDPRWAQWCAKVVKGAVKEIVGGELWVSLGGAKKVQGYLRLGHQEIPLGKGGFWVAGGKTGAKGVLTGLNGALGGIAAVDMWRS